MVALTKSCLKVLDCTYDAGLDMSTLDAMPDIDCDSETHQTTKWVAIHLLGIYIIVIPFALYRGLAAAKSTGRINDHEFLQGHGWFLLKYRPVRTAI